MAPPPLLLLLLRRCKSKPAAQVLDDDVLTTAGRCDTCIVAMPLVHALQSRGTEAGADEAYRHSEDVCAIKQPDWKERVYMPDQASL